MFDLFDASGNSPDGPFVTAGSLCVESCDASWPLRPSSGGTHDEGDPAGPPSPYSRCLPYRRRYRFRSSGLTLPARSIAIAFSVWLEVMRIRLPRYTAPLLRVGLACLPLPSV